MISFYLFLFLSSLEFCVKTPIYPKACTGTLCYYTTKKNVDLAILSFFELAKYVKLGVFWPKYTYLQAKYMY